jgi:hypothetical protein
MTWLYLFGAISTLIAPDAWWQTGDWNKMTWLYLVGAISTLIAPDAWWQTGDWNTMTWLYLVGAISTLIAPDAWLQTGNWNTMTWRYLVGAISTLIAPDAWLQTGNWNTMTWRYLVGAISTLMVPKTKHKLQHPMRGDVLVRSVAYHAALGCYRKHAAAWLLDQTDTASKLRGIARNWCSAYGWVPNQPPCHLPGISEISPPPSDITPSC